MALIVASEKNIIKYTDGSPYEWPWLKGQP